MLHREWHRPGRGSVPALWLSTWPLARRAGARMHAGLRSGGQEGIGGKEGHGACDLWPGGRGKRARGEGTQI
jgi:hypothetical protein